MFGLIGFVFAIFGLITNKSIMMPYMFFFLGAMLLVIGLAELQKDRKGFWAYINIIASLFAFFVSIQGFLLR